jgi:hypothetical protein
MPEHDIGCRDIIIGSRDRDTDTFDPMILSLVALQVMDLLCITTSVLV